MPLYRATTALRGEAAARGAARRARRARPGAAGERAARPRRRLGPLGRRRALRRAARRGRAGAARAAARRAGLRGGAGRGPRLGGAGARRADAGRGGAVRRLRQPRPGAGRRSNRIGLEIEAAQAFGTGHHATTQGCLTALDRLVRRGLVGAAGRRHRRRHRRAGDGGGRGLAGAGDRRRHRPAGDRDGARERGGERPRRPGRLRHRGRASATRGCTRGAPYDLIFANILAGPLRRLAPRARGAPRAGRRRDPVGHPGAAGARA